MSNTGDVDDPGTLGGLHLVQEEVGQQEVAQMVDLEHHLLSVLGDNSLGREGRCVVDEDVHLLLLLVDLLAELSDRGEGREVTLDDPDVGETNLGSRSLRQLRVPAGHDDLGSSHGQAPGGLLPDAPVGARHDGHTPREVDLRELPVRLPALGPVLEVLQHQTQAIVQS